MFKILGYYLVYYFYVCEKIVLYWAVSFIIYFYKVLQKFIHTIIYSVHVNVNSTSIEFMRARLYGDGETVVQLFTHFVFRSCFLFYILSDFRLNDKNSLIVYRCFWLKCCHFKAMVIINSILYCS